MVFRKEKNTDTSSDCTSYSSSGSGASDLYSATKWIEKLEKEVISTCNFKATSLYPPTLASLGSLIMSPPISLH